MTKEVEDACAAAQAESQELEIELIQTPITVTTYTGTETATTVSVQPLVARPRRVVNAAQEMSCGEAEALVWEAVSFNDQGRAWQWRAWFDGICVGMVTWSQRRRRYLAAAMRKRIGAFAGQQVAWTKGSDQAVPPSIDAVNAVSYTVVELITSGAAVEADQDAILEFGEGPAADIARQASARLLRAHEARYEVDELDLDAVAHANASVQEALEVCEVAYTAAVQAGKTESQRAKEAREAIDASSGQIADFNAKNAAAGRSAH